MHSRNSIKKRCSPISVDSWKYVSMTKVCKEPRKSIHFFNFSIVNFSPCCWTLLASLPLKLQHSHYNVVWKFLWSHHSSSRCPPKLYDRNQEPTFVPLTHNNAVVHQFLFQRRLLFLFSALLKLWQELKVWNITFKIIWTSKRLWYQRFWGVLRHAYFI